MNIDQVTIERRHNPSDAAFTPSKPTAWIPVGGASVMIEWRKQGVIFPAFFDVDMGVALKKGVPTLEIHDLQYIAPPKVVK